MNKVGQSCNSKVVYPTSEGRRDEKDRYILRIHRCGAQWFLYEPHIVSYDAEVLKTVHWSLWHLLLEHGELQNLDKTEYILSML